MDPVLIAGAACTRHSAPRARQRAWPARILAATIWICAAGLVANSTLAADAVAPLERTVKAAFVYRFLTYVEWPPEAFARPDAPIVIGVYGADDIAVELAQILPGRTAAERPIEVRRQKEGDPLTGLHVLFVGRVESARIEQLTREAQQLSILTISESAGALELGTVINLVLSDGRVRFEVALDTAEKSRLKLSSRMLALALSVRNDRT